MDIKDLRISATDIARYGVQAAPNILTGTPQENKEVFDRLVAEVMRPRFNALCDMLTTEISGIKARLDALENK